MTCLSMYHMHQMYYMYHMYRVCRMHRKKLDVVDQWQVFVLLPFVSVFVILPIVGSSPVHRFWSESNFADLARWLKYCAQSFRVPKR